MSETKRTRTSATPESIEYAVAESSLGLVLVATSARGVRAILLGDHADEMLRDLQRRFPRADIAPGGKQTERMAERAVELVEKPAAVFDAPLDVQGTEFQRLVWDALREVAPGQTVSYREIAERIGRPTALRAVGSAVGANPVAVAVPCHRVLRADGEIGGYRWGVERKRALLQREGVTVDQGTPARER